MRRLVHVHFLPSELTTGAEAGHSLAVIDLLRASTTICTALAHGARDVIPVETPERAKELGGTLGRESVLLCGERKGTKIDGFDLGNSPAEYTRDRVAGKSLLFCSTNGSGALLAARDAGRIAMAGLVNAGAVVNWLVEGQNSAVLLCSGQLGRFSAEDAACAGYLTLQLMNQGFEPGNDAARAALLLAHQAKSDWPTFLAATDHGRYLVDLGFSADLKVAAAIDSLAVVPEWNDTRLIVRQPVRV